MYRTGLGVAGVLLLALGISAQVASGLAQSADSWKDEIPGSLQKFLRCFAEGDAVKASGIWNRSAPGRDKFTRGMEVLRLRRMQASFDDVQMEIRLVSPLEAEAVVRGKLGRKDAGGQKIGQWDTVWHITLRRQRQQWRIQQLERGEDRIAASLLNAEDARTGDPLAKHDQPITPLLIEAMLRLADNLESKGNRPAAITAAKIAQRAALRIGDRFGAADSLMLSASAHIAVSEKEEALREIEEAEKQFVLLNDKLGQSQALHGRAKLKNNEGQLDEALDLFHRAMQLSDSIGDNRMIARILVSAAGPEIDKGRFPAAMTHLTKALQLATASGDDSARARAFHNLGDVYAEQRNYDIAMDRYRQALALKKRLQDRSGIANTLNSMAVVRIYQRRCREAQTFLQQSLDDAIGTGDKVLVGFVLNQIGSCFVSAGQTERGLEKHRQALEASEEIKNASTIVTSAINVAYDLDVLKRFDEALPYAEHASKTAEQIGDLPQLWQARVIAGNILLGQNQIARSRTALLDAIRIVEQLRGEVSGSEESEAGFFADKVTPYHLILKSFILEKRNIDALGYAERARGRLLLDILRGGRREIGPGLQVSERAEERQLRERLASLNRDLLAAKQSETPNQARQAGLERQLDAARVAYQAFKTEIFARHRELKVQRAEVEWTGLPAASELLPDAGTAILEYAVAEAETWLFVLTRPAAPMAAVEVNVYRIPWGADRVKKSVEAFRQKIAKRDYNFTDSAQELYNRFLDPAAKQLQGKNTLVILPDGALWELPFQVLRHSNEYVLEKFAVLYAPSLAVLHENRTNVPSRPHETKLLGFGNPRLAAASREELQDRLRGVKLGPLPDAERELQSSAKTFGAQRSRVYLWSDALESRFKTEAAGYSTLHFATHAIRDNRHPLYSYLLLARALKGDREDGVLEAWEVMEMKLDAELAILSACETAGAAGEGEGIIGLAWAFFVAGTPITVASQWSVESANTSDLMIGFHRELSANRGNYGSALPKARALRKAAIPMIEKGLHPFYWGGFVTIGTRL